MNKVSEISKKYFSDMARKVTDDGRMAELEKANVISAPELQEYEWQRYGHDCDVCQKPWKLHTFKSDLGESSIFKPGCSCYPVCNYCGRSLVFEVVNGLPGCRSCQFDEKKQEWKYGLFLCHKRVKEKSSGRRGDGSGTYEECCGNMKLIDRFGNRECDKCGRKAKFEKN
jgi:hypothetical protein